MTRVIETDEIGQLILPPELLGHVKPYTRFIVEPEGTKLIVHLDAAFDTAQHDRPQKLTPDEWLKQSRELAEEIGKVWPANKTAADVISEMRR